MRTTAPAAPSSSSPASLSSGLRSNCCDWPGWIRSGSMGWVILAVAFAGVWVYAFYREDIKNPEPLWLVGLAMVGGMIAFPVTSRLEAILSQDPTAIAGTLSARAELALLFAGP